MNCWPRRLPCVSLLGALLLACAAGCGGAKKVPPMKLNAGAAAAEAFKLYDKNGDGKLEGEELAACPALAAAVGKEGSPLDGNKDGQLTAAELQARIGQFLAAPVQMITGTVQIKLDGSPLEGATVTFEPEPFLASLARTATGKTDASGTASLSTADAQFPGFYLGYYRVRISKQVNGQEQLPAKYNTETTLGYEAHTDASAELGVTRFELSSK